MKPFVLLFLLVSPLLVAGALETSTSGLPPLPPLISLNTTEKASVKSAAETNLESVQQSAASTDSPAVITTVAAAKDNAIHQPDETKKLDPRFLHRIPIYHEDRNPLVETIASLNAKAKDAVQELKNVAAEEKTNGSTSAPATTELELPIPSRCPHITGTAEEDAKAGAKGHDWMPLLGVGSKPKAAQRGCRFFIMNELMERSSAAFAHASPADQLNRTLNNCFNSCIQAYDNGTEVCDACFDGCRKTAAVTEIVKKALPPAGDELEREEAGDGLHSPEMHRSFSIIIPLRPLPEIEGTEQKTDGSESPADGGAFPSMMPNAIKMMLQMMHQMTERARQAMIQQQQQHGQDAGAGSGSNIQESEVSIDPSSGSISVSRSMSVLMTKDKDGHSKMVVVHTLPKIQVHRFGGGQGGLFGSDEDDDLTHPFHDLSNGKEHSEGDEDSADDELIEDGDNFRVRLFGHLSSGGKAGHHHQTKDTLDEKESGASSTQVYFYRSRLCYYLPRLFYLTMAILILYVVFWLLCAVPALYGRNGLRRQSLDSSVSSISGASGVDGDSKRKKFYFTKNARYFQLNNKRNSTTSLPPPYPGAGADSESGALNGAESCAEPLPEKQPLPEGGLEIKLDSRSDK